MPCLLLAGVVLPSALAWSGCSDRSRAERDYVVARVYVWHDRGRTGHQIIVDDPLTSGYFVGEQTTISGSVEDMPLDGIDDSRLKEDESGRYLVAIDAVDGICKHLLVIGRADEQRETIRSLRRRGSE